MGNHLSVIIDVKDGIKIETALVSHQGLNVATTTPRQLSVKGERADKPLSMSLRSDDARIVAEVGKFHDGSLAYDTICDALGEALYDADNKRLWINIK